MWAVDAERAPLYWFPRDCPRVTAWPRSDAEQVAFRDAFTTTARRVHAIELGWLPSMSTTVLYRYRFDAATFRPWQDAVGQWISDSPVEAIDVEPVGDLLDLHVAAQHRTARGAVALADPGSRRVGPLGLQHRADDERSTR